MFVIWIPSTARHCSWVDPSHTHTHKHTHIFVYIVFVDWMPSTRIPASKPPPVQYNFKVPYDKTAYSLPKNAHWDWSDFLNRFDCGQISCPDPIDDSKQLSIKYISVYIYIFFLLFFWKDLSVDKFLVQTLLMTTPTIVNKIYQCIYIYFFSRQ